MLKQKTRKRIAAAVSTVTDLKLYLERAIRKLDEEPDPQDASSDLHGLANWVRV